jgi:hypothetical protein
LAAALSGGRIREIGAPEMRTCDALESGPGALGALGRGDDPGVGESDPEIGLRSITAPLGTACSVT